MTKRIFVSYSSPDVAKANAIRAALEDAGISCWIAPRDLGAGTQWSGGIVQAIEQCEAVLVVFSAAANNSPQVAREMEQAVSKRRPLIPIRVADDRPTDDMQYFLGVSHWFNAYAKPIDAYLHDIVIAVQRVLAAERKPWAMMARRLPQSRNGMIIAAAAGAVLLALLVVWMMKPSIPSMDSPLKGRWQASLPDGKGGTTDCLFDVQSMGLAAFSDSCPQPLMGMAGSANVIPNGMLAPDLFKSGDQGTFSFFGNTNFAAAYRFSFFGSLITRDAKFGEVKWSSISQEGALPSGMDTIIVQPTWPLKDVPGVAKRARDYMRDKWHPDAVLTSLDVKLLKANEGGAANIQTPDGGLELRMNFYSPSTQQGASFRPMEKRTSAIFPMGVVNSGSWTRPLPDDFLDLPDAVKRLNTRAPSIYQAQLENWSPGTSYGRARLNGVQWMIDTPLDERFVVPAMK